MQKVNKKLASAIVLGLMMAVPVGASASEADYTGSVVGNLVDGVLDLKGKDKVVFDSGESADGIIRSGNAEITNGGDLIVTGSEWKGTLFLAGANTTININNINSFTIGEVGVVNQYRESAFSTMNGKISVNATNNIEVYGVELGAHAQRTNRGDADKNEGYNNPSYDVSVDIHSENGNVVIHTKESGTTLSAANYDYKDRDSKEAKVSVSGENVELIADNGNGIVIGSYSYDYSNSNNDERNIKYAGKTSVEVTATDELTLKGKIFAYNGYEKDDAKVILKGNDITVVGDIEADRNAYVSIGAKDTTSTNYKATITGDITATNNSTVDIDLGNGGSFTGAATTGDTESNEEESSININMGTGSVWNVTGDSTVSIITGSGAVSTISSTDATASAGTVNLNGNSLNAVMNNVDTVNFTKGSVWNVTGDSAVSTITGEGTIGFEVNEDDNGTYSVASTVTAQNSDAKLTVTASNYDADDVDLTEAKKIFDVLKGKVTSNGKDAATGMEIKETITSGAITADKDGVAHQAQYSSTEANMRDIASVALVAWRQEDSTLSQRLGELRNSEGDQGIWARMSRGEFEYSGAFKNQYNYFQMGYDWAAEDWHYGAAISHNDGQTTYANGNGENDSTSLTLYGTWLGDKGQYTDIVVKHGKLNNEFTNYAEAGVTTGDYDMWGTSISAEYGQKLEMNNDWYVTPQAQLTYMVIGSEDYTATVTDKDGVSSPMQVSQDSMNSVVGRVGFEAGKHISDKGSIYAKASLLHEFAGEADTSLLYGDKPGTYSQDLGDTWYECGIGVNYKTSDNSYVYADVVKTFGGDVETPWQWNAGMRFTF